MALLLAGGALIGFLLAVLGAGGSILLLPLLVSGAALPTKAAVPLSLLVVTLLALGNLGPYIRRRQIAIKPALVLGLPALAGSWIGGSLVKADLIPEAMQLGIFAAAALFASWLLSRPSALGQAASPRRPGGSPLALAGQGILVGLLTGIAGVGGGFALVPALVLLAGLPMQLASGTSLLLISTNSLVALAALGYWPAAQLPLLLPLVAGGLVGAVVGQRLAPHLPELQLRQGFAALLIGSALLTGYEAWQHHQRLPSPPRPTANRQPLFPARWSPGTPVSPLLLCAAAPHRPFRQLDPPPPARP
ncbi:MAG TPA: sulfite exporter TauE/SafE family protein [Synechococcales bacterium UBA10510]|nr:sulfite exporter TauE/SafE family protein [Synechococcales bacterium UBA10510]